MVVSVLYVQTDCQKIALDIVKNCKARGCDVRFGCYREHRGLRLAIALIRFGQYRPPVICYLSLILTNSNDCYRSAKCIHGVAVTEPH